MTIEERVRRMLAEAVASEPAPSGAPLDRAVRYRRRRPLRLVAVAMALLLVAAGVVVGVRALTNPVSLPSTPPAVPSGWKSFQAPSFYNLKFRYPPDWTVQSRGALLIGPGQPARTGGSQPATPGPFSISVSLGLQYYLFVLQNGTRVTPGRLPDGRQFIRWTSQQGGVRTVGYNIDWGQSCMAPGRECGIKSMGAVVQASSQALLDRYGQVAEQIVRTFQQARPTVPSTGDPRRPACRPDQWRPVLSSRNAAALDGPAGWVIAGDVRYLGGPACHLRTTLRLTVEQADGSQLQVPGTPAVRTLEADLPQLVDVAQDVPRSATMWYWRWDNWCRQPLPRARVRVTADGGASATRPLAPASIQDPHNPCRRGAPWRVVPLP